MKNFGDRFGKITETKINGNKTEITQKNVIKGRSSCQFVGVMKSDFVCRIKRRVGTLS